jgi:hypothetical protein
LHNTLTDVATVIVILQYLHSTLIYVAAVFVVHCSVLAFDVATLVAGTAAVTVLYGTCVTKFLSVLR